MNHGITSQIYADLAGIDSPRADFFRRIFKDRFSKQIKEIGTCYDPDPLAVAVALEPAIIREAKSRYVQVELGGQLTRGQTVVDWFDLAGRPANANLVLDVDQDRFSELMKLGLQ